MHFRCPKTRVFGVNTNTRCAHVFEVVPDHVARCSPPPWQPSWCMPKALHKGPGVCPCPEGAHGSCQGGGQDGPRPCRQEVTSDPRHYDIMSFPSNTKSRDSVHPRGYPREAPGRGPPGCLLTPTGPWGYPRPLVGGEGIPRGGTPGGSPGVPLQRGVPKWVKMADFGV